MNDTITQSQLNKSRFDKFLLVLNLPPILKNVETTEPTPGGTTQRSKDLVYQDSLQFSVYGSVIPSIKVPELVAGYGGGSYKVSSNNRPPYDNITVNFTIDNKFNNYWVIYRWLKLLSDDKVNTYDTVNILNPSPSTTLPKPLQPQAYQTDFTIYGKDEFDQNVIKFTYTKAFPVTLGGIEYNYRQPSEIETSFEFAFSQFFAELV
jgi:hypothetical protein